MSVEHAVKQLADCPHSMAISAGDPVVTEAQRCPHCGAMRFDRRGSWAWPHLVAQLITEWRKEHPDGSPGTADNVAR